MRVRKKIVASAIGYVFLVLGAQGVCAEENGTQKTEQNRSDTSVEWEETEVQGRRSGLAQSRGPAVPGMSWGTNASASPGAVASGYNATSGQSGAAYGLATSASFEGVAIGSYATAAGDRGVAIGTYTNAGADGTALGKQATASGSGSVALGSSSVADRANTVSVGSSSLKRTITNVQAGEVTAGSTDAINGSQFFNHAQALDALNEKTLALSKQIVFGNSASASGANTVALGNGANAGTWWDSVIVGSSTTSEGVSATAIGNGAKGMGNYATALGSNTNAGGLSVAVGSDSNANSTGVSIGYNSTANGNASVVIGAGANATQLRSVAIGYGSVADQMDTVSVGSSSLKRTITNVKAGQIGAESADAVNGSQLYSLSTSMSTSLSTTASNVVVAQTGVSSLSTSLATTRTNLTSLSTSTKADIGVAQSGVSSLSTSVRAIGARADSFATSVAQALGGGAHVEDDGTLNAPVYQLTDPGSLHAETVYRSVGAALENLNVRAKNNTKDIESINDRAITYSENPDGTPDYNAVTLGGGKTDKAVVLSNVAEAVADTDAVNLNQLRKYVANNTDGNGLVAADGALAKNEVSLNGANPATRAAIAVGAGSTANGGDTISVGLKAFANADNAVAIGSYAQTSDGGKYSVAMGSQATTQASESVAIGAKVAANAANALAVGSNTSAAGTNSVALGNSALVRPGADNSIAIGMGAEIARDVKDAIALGMNAIVAKDAHGGVALGEGSVANRANAVSIGSSSVQRQIINVAAGTAQTDAVNIGQLKGAIDALGGGAAIGSDGNIAAPTYTVGNKDYHNVGAALDALASATDPNAVAYDDASKTVVTFSGEGGTRLKNVKAGAITAESSDAINGSQLHGMAQSVADALGGGAQVGQDGKLTSPSYSLNGATLTNVGAALTNLDGRVISNTADIADLKLGVENAVAYDDDAKAVVTFGGEGGTTLRNVTAGAIAAGSMEAVNGSQLHGTAQSVADAMGGGAKVDQEGRLTAPSYTLNGTTLTNVGAALTNLDGRVSANTTDISDVKENLTTSGLVDQDGKVAAVVTYDRDAAGVPNYASVTLGGGKATGEVILKNVATGKSNTDAVNVGQMNAGLADLKDELTSGAIDLKFVKVNANPNTDAAASVVGTKAVAIGSAAASTGAYTLALGTGARATADRAVALGYNSVASEEDTLSVGAYGSERRIVNVANGKVSDESTDAINGSQLHGVAQSVADALGGGATVSRDGKLTAPSYTLNGTTLTNVGAALTNLDGRVSSNTADLADLKSIATSMEESTRKLRAEDSIVVVDGQSGSNSASLNGADAGSRTAAAIGVKSVANGGDTIAVGLNAVTNADNAVAIGSFAQTSDGGKYSVAMGSQAMTQSSESVAIGAKVAANAANALAVGSNTTAAGINSIALGNGALVRPGAGNSIAIGTNANVVRDIQNAVALGMDSRADRSNTVSVGKSGAERQIVNVAEGTQSTDAVNLKQMQDYVAQNGGSGTSNPLAVAYDGVDKSKLTLAGGAVGTKITNLQAGDVSATSSDAITGSQLHGTAESTASALGGGSTVGADGRLSAPSYSLEGGAVKAVNVGQAVANLDGRVTTNTAAISELQNAIDGAPTSNAVVTYDRHENGSANRTSITLGDAGMPVALHNVAMGAVRAGSTDAINGSQLHGTTQSVATAISGSTTVSSDGKLAASISVNGQDYTTVESAIQAAALTGSGALERAVVYDNNERTQLTLGGLTKAGAAVKLTNVANGAIAAGSSDAVNGSQLYDMAQSVASTIGGGTTVGTDGKLANTSIRVNGDSYNTVEDAIQAAAASGSTDSMAVKYDNDSRTSVTLGGTAAGAPIVLSNVANGVNQYDAVNFGQLSELASKVDHVDGRVSILEQAPAGGSGGSGGGTVADWDLNAGGEKITNVGNATEKTDAVNLGQMNDAIQASVGLPAGTTAKDYTDQQIQGVRGQINDVSKNAYSGIAAATALTMIPGVDPGKTLSFGIGGATYKGYQAVALGGEARINQNLKVKAGVGLSSGGNTVGMGASYQW